MRPILVWLSLGLGVLLFIPFALTADWPYALTLLERAQPMYLLVYLGSTALILALLAYRWYVIVRASAIRISFRKLWSYQLARTAVSFVTPGPRVGGDAVAAGLLTRHRNRRGHTRFSEAISTLALDRAVEAQTFSLLFFIGIFVLALSGTLPVYARIPLLAIASLYLALATGLVIGLARGKLILTMLVKRFAKNPRTLRAVRRFEQTTMTFYRERPRAYLSALGVSALAWLLSLVEYSAALQLLGFSVPLWGVFLVYSFVGFAYLVPIPLAIGSLETAQATAFSILGLSSVGGLLLAFLIRIRDGFIALIGFLILGSYGFTRKRTP